METQAELVGSIEDLSTGELTYVFQSLFQAFESSTDPVVDEDAITERFEADVAFLIEVGESLGVDADHLADARPHDVLLALAGTSPELQKHIADGIANLRSRSTLPADAGDVALVILATAAALAIMRPKITKKEKSDLFAESKSFAFEVQGVKSVESLIRALLAYIRSHDLGS